MPDTLTRDEMVKACAALMEEKSLTVVDLEAEGWGHPADLSDDELEDVLTWLDTERPKRKSRVARTDVQSKMLSEAQAAGRKASDAQRSEAEKRGLLYDKQIGNYRVTVGENTRIKKEGRVAIVGTVWLHKARLHTERDMVSETALEGKVKQMANWLIEKKVRS